MCEGSTTTSTPTRRLMQTTKVLHEAPIRVSKQPMELPAALAYEQQKKTHSPCLEPIIFPVHHGFSNRIIFTAVAITLSCGHPLHVSYQVQQKHIAWSAVNPVMHPPSTSSSNAGETAHTQTSPGPLLRIIFTGFSLTTCTRPRSLHASQGANFQNFHMYLPARHASSSTANHARCRSPSNPCNQL